jgi:hypothetical protein
MPYPPAADTDRAPVQYLVITAEWLLQPAKATGATKDKAHSPVYPDVGPQTHFPSGADSRADMDTAPERTRDLSTGRPGRGLHPRPGQVDPVPFALAFPKPR